MLNRFYHMAEELTEPFTPRITVAHIVDGRPDVAMERPRRVAQLLKHLYSAEGNYPFCLVLRGGDVVALMREVLLLFFHPCYVLAERGRPVFVDRSTEALERLFREQRLEVEVLAIGDVKMLHADGHDPAGDYYRYCLTSYAPDDVFLLAGGDMGGWSQELERVDRALAENFLQFHRLASDRFAAGELAARQRREIGRLREERKIMEELLELSNKHDEVNYILRFYRNEYEILPLWYKQLGHIIKVIQGKRAFRSLFDKSVKKYKD
jgi:hypothetical protein